MLQTVEKPDLTAGDGLTEEAKRPEGVMVNADGQYVVALNDEASWNKYQAKAQASAAQASAATSGSKELQDRPSQAGQVCRRIVC